jgi:Protein of unknown function (DUF1615)
MFSRYLAILYLLPLGGCLTNNKQLTENSTITPYYQPQNIQTYPTYASPPTVEPRAVTQPPILRNNAVNVSAKIISLLPSKVNNKELWSTDIERAIESLDLEPSKENICSVIAVIDQESSFQEDPVVLGLDKIVTKEIERKRDSYHIPKFVVDTALNKKSKTGETYRQRIRHLKTEKDVNQLFYELINQLPFGEEIYSRKNPIKTAGPMQTQVSFAESLVKEKKYPYLVTRTIRDEVFTRRGGIYFGTAMLLSYRAPYVSRKFYFADYNSGRYSSRNAAFQYAVSRIANIPLDLDGDLLLYDSEGTPLKKESHTKKVLKSINRTLTLSVETIGSDLALEKRTEFENTETWQKVYGTFTKKFGSPTLAMLPNINLNSPKINRKLTTAWFAETVEKRYNNCLSR